MIENKESNTQKFNHSEESPTFKLNSLTSKINRLLNALITLSESKTTKLSKDKLLELRRRCYIMSLLYDRTIIAITGLQGVGKSTLVSSLYDYEFENSPFLCNQGQGETLPILITEDDNHGKFFVHRVNAENWTIVVEKEEIKNISKFKEISHRYNEKTDLFLEITVPKKIFNGADVQFLLLPGFQSDNDYLKELTYSSLMASRNCLILFYQAKYAHQNNKELIELLNKNFSDAKPIFLITNSDINNENSELAKRVKEDLKINEDDRVLRTGIPGPEGWKNEVIKSIKKYSKPGIEPISIQKTNVRKLVKDIGEVIIDIKMELRDFDIVLDNKEYKQLDKIIKEFKSVSSSLKKELRIAIDEHFNPYFENIQVNILNKLLETRKSFFDKIKTGIGDTLKSQTEIQNELVEKIKTSFHESNDISVDMNYILALNQVVNKEMLRHKIVMGLPQDDKNTNLDSKKLLVGETQKMQVDKLNDNKSDIKETLSKDIKLLVNSKIEGEFSDDLKFNIKLLPLIMLETERFINIVEGSNDRNLILIGDFADQKTLTDVYSENRKEVALAITALFGLDIAEGGGIDLFGILPSVSAQTAVAFSVNWYVLGALSLISAIYLNSLFNKSFDAKVNFTKNEIKDIKNQFIENLMSNFDNKMDFIEDIIRGSLTRRLGLDFDFARLQNCHIALKDLEEVKKEIEKLSRSEL